VGRGGEGLSVGRSLKVLEGHIMVHEIEGGGRILWRHDSRHAFFSKKITRTGGPKEGTKGGGINFPSRGSRNNSTE